MFITVTLFAPLHLLGEALYKDIYLFINTGWQHFSSTDLSECWLNHEALSPSWGPYTGIHWRIKLLPTDKQNYHRR